MPKPLQKITLTYVDREDRISLVGEVGEGQRVVLWMTQRLILRLLPHLIEWVERQFADTPRADALLSFSQEAARAQLEPSAPVKADPGQTGWLVETINVTPTDNGLGLVFNSAEGEPVSLHLQAQQLRQWLSILHDQCERGGWPMAAWPEWLASSPASASHSGSLLH